MTAMHPTVEELELYVADELSGSRATEIEDHAAGCDACGVALAAEARLELALEQIAGFRAEHDVVPMAPGRSRSRSIVGAALMAAAALLVVAAGEAIVRPAPSQPAPAAVVTPAADAGVTVARDDGGETR